MPDEKYVWKTRTWEDNWNNVIRYVLYQDDILKEYMLVPDDGTVAIDKFIKNYFIRSAMPDALVTDQKVRVIYYETEGQDMNIQQARMRYLEFDVYVKDSEEHTIGRDR
jgi:hypothetical protein